MAGKVCLSFKFLIFLIDVLLRIFQFYPHLSHTMVISRSEFLVPAWISLVVFITILDVVLSADGSWGKWTEWESCSASCGAGIRRRYRFCNNPPPSNGGNWCDGKPREVEPCQAPFDCPVNGGWGEWTIWTVCSVSCGEGVMNRFRVCDSPEPANGGQHCEGDPFETTACFALKDCPRDGKWTSWSHWSPCSVTCGSDGSNFRYRSCNNPPPLADGKPCAGSNQQSRRCHAPQKCAVNGQWSEWNEWTSCSVTCGSGVRTRWRKCDNPPPQNGGMDCPREDAGEMQERSCNGTVVFCPVNGGWSDWGEWGECITPDCHNPKQFAYRFRDRSCSDPFPGHKGSMCQGTFLDAGICEGPTNCAVDGEWSEWADWSCTEFVAVRRRTCDSPPPSNGGRPCKGDELQQYTFDEVQYQDACPDFVGKVDENDDEDIAEGSGAPVVDPRNNNDEDDEDEEEDD